MKTEYTSTMIVEITRYGFKLLNSNGVIVEEAEPANKGKLHRLLCKLGYKPTHKHGEWSK